MAPSDSVDKQMSSLDTHIPQQRKSRKPSVVTAQLTRSIATQGRLCLFNHQSEDKAVYKSALFSVGTKSTSSFMHCHARADNILDFRKTITAHKGVC